MQRGDNTSIPLLRARRFGEDIRTRNTRQGHFYYSLLVIVALVGLVVLGLCLFGGITSFTVREPMAEKSSFSIYLVKDDFKNGKLSSEQLGKLVGVYYSRDPEHDDLKTMFNQGIQVITREQLPEKTRVIPPGGMVTMDFVEDRLNVHLDNKSHIKKAKYG